MTGFLFLKNFGLFTVCKTSQCLYGNDYECIRNEGRRFWESRAVCDVIHLIVFHWCCFMNSGKTCESVINYCECNPCFNGGSCQNRVDGYYCHCSFGKSSFQPLMTHLLFSLCVCVCACHVLFVFVILTVSG